MIVRLRLAFERIGLLAWFAAIDVVFLVRPDDLGIDARHYQRAADAWLSGGDPWAVTERGITFAAGPHTLLPYAVTSVLPLTASTWLWLALGVAASIWTVRRLGLPSWWLLFPPMFHAAWNGNPQSIALAAVLVGGPTLVRGLGASVSVVIKLYAAIPLIRRPREWAIVGVVLLVGLVVLPWQQYVADGFGVRDHLSTAWDGSAWRLPILIPLVVAALWVLRRDGAEWLAVPALWPATQFYYSGMALPALVRRPLLAAAFALPMVLLPPVSVIALAAHRLWVDRRGTAAPLDRAVPAGA